MSNRKPNLARSFLALVPSPGSNPMTACDCRMDRIGSLLSPCSEELLHDGVPQVGVLGPLDGQPVLRVVLHHEWHRSVRKNILLKFFECTSNHCSSYKQLFRSVFTNSVFVLRHICDMI
jgi:hypothetical protein